MTTTQPGYRPDTTLLTAEQAAAQYRVNAATVRRWCRTGRVQGAYRQLPGNIWRIPAPLIFTRQDR